MNSSYHESKGQFCSDCRYAHPFSNDHEQYSCRRYAPRPLPSNAFGHVDDRVTYWPLVFCEEWCGEWRSREDRA
jgi:hypothetical protein